MATALETFTSLSGDVAIGFYRSELQIIHVIAKGPPGSRFRVGPHFRDCYICKENGVTESEFAEYMLTVPPRLSGGTLP